MAKVHNELANYKNVPRELVFDKNLSDRARFVYVFMSCKPIDWDFFLEPMAKEIGYSVETLRKYLNELVDNGWIVKGAQENTNGRFGATEYTIKANKDLPQTENAVSEKYRVGKIPTQHNIDNGQIIDYNKNNKEKIKELKEKFARFVSLYKKAGGKVREVNTEFDAFSKRHKDWAEVIPYLEMALQRETKERNQAKVNKTFYPEMKMLKTYLGKQRAWELFVTIGEPIKKEEYTPQCDLSLQWNDYYKCYMYTGYWNGWMPDGYNDDTRPNGATVVLNNGRGVISWDAETKEWRKTNE